MTHVMMNLTEAIGLGTNETVMVVGGGGKTSTLIQLAREARSAGHPALLSTTTKVSAGEFSGFVVLKIADQVAQTAEAVRGRWARGETPLVVGGFLTQQKKYVGISPLYLESMRDFLGSGSFLVEADGARNCPLKVPRDHEPVLGSVADLVVCVVGAEVIGNALTPEICYNVEKARKLLGWESDSERRLSVDSLALLLTSSQGGRKGVRASQRFVVLINKVEGFCRTRQAFALKERLHQEGIEVVVASLQNRVIYDQGPPEVAMLILAAGSSSRMGSQKQTLPCAGGTFLEATVRLYQLFGPVIVVLGHRGRALQKQLDYSGARVLINDEYTSGMSSSLRCGLEEAEASGVEGILLGFCDMPHLRAETIDQILSKATEEPGKIVIPSFDGQKGHPVYLPRHLFGELKAVTGDLGARDVVKQHLDQVIWLPVEDQAVIEDIDSPEIYERVRMREGWDS